VPVIDRESPHRVVRISARSAIIGVGVLVVAIVAERVFVAAHRPLSWAAAAVIVAVLIDPIVDVLDRHIPRLAAVLVALLLLGVAGYGVVILARDDLSNGIDRLSVAAQDAAASLEKRDGRLGQAARDIDVTRRVDLFVDALNERVTGGGELLQTAAGTVPTYFLGGILTLFLMSYGPRVAKSAVEQLPDEHTQREVTEVVTRALQRSRRAVLLTLAEGLAIGLVVAGIARLLDLPAPTALGLMAGTLALLPDVGLILGTSPLVLLLLALRSDAEAAAATIVIVACQLADSYWLRRKISRRSVHVGLLVPWVVALVGYSVYGVGGAAYGLVFAVFVLAVLDELGARTPDATMPDEEPRAAPGDGVAAHPSPAAEGLPGYVRAE